MMTKHSKAVTTTAGKGRSAVTACYIMNQHFQKFQPKHLTGSRN